MERGCQHENVRKIRMSHILRRKIMDFHMGKASRCEDSMGGRFEVSFDQILKAKIEMTL